jgi:hypothetical protein
MAAPAVYPPRTEYPCNATFTLPVSVRERLARFAHDKRIPASHVVRDALIAYLDALEKKAATR